MTEANSVWTITAIVVVCLLTVLLGIHGLRLSRTTSDFYVASRAVTPWRNAAAIGGEYLSAASFLGVAGLIYTSGLDMLWFPVGYTLGYLVLLARQLHRIDQSVRSGIWLKPRGRSLTGLTLGIVGLGSIGRAVARRAIAMRMHVVGSDVSPDAREAAASEAILVASVDELFGASHIVVLCSTFTACNCTARRCVFLPITSSA